MYCPHFYPFSTATPKIKRSKGRSDTISDGGEGPSLTNLLLMQLLFLDIFLLSSFSTLFYLFIYFWLFVCWQIYWKALKSTLKDLPRNNLNTTCHLLVSTNKRHLGLVFLYPLLMIVCHFKVFIAPSISCTFVYPSLKEKGLWEKKTLEIKRN